MRGGIGSLLLALFLLFGGTLGESDSQAVSALPGHGHASGSPDIYVPIALRYREQMLHSIRVASQTAASPVQADVAPPFHGARLRCRFMSWLW